MRALVLLVFVCLSTACGGAPTAPGTEFLEFTSVTPPNGTAVKPGSSVTISAAIKSTLVHFNSGYVVMIVQDQVGRVVQTRDRPQPQAVLTKGTSTSELSDSITVPDDAIAIDVVAALFVEGSTRTAAVVKVRYPVQ